jgi:hypothetical protein
MTHEREEFSEPNSGMTRRDAVCLAGRERVGH